MKNKEALSSYRLITRRPVDNFLTRDELISIRDNQGMAAVENIIGSGNVWANVEGLDLTDLPKFVFKNESISSSILSALIEIFILIFLNILFFSLAWISFLRADVR